MLLLVHGAALDLVTVPLASPDVRSVIVPWRGDTPALAVQDGRALQLVPLAGGAAVPVRLPDDAVAWDVAPLTGGEPELLVLTNRALLAFALDALEPEARTLFAVDHLLAREEPAPRALALTYDGRPALAIPAPNGFELRRPNGRLVASYPYRAGSGASHLGAGFSAWAVSPPVAASPGGLELRVARVRAYESDLPSGLAGERGAASHRRVSPTQFVEAASRAHAQWPWFPLTSRGDATDRVLYAPALPGLRDTVVRIRRAAPRPEPGGDGVSVSPERQYPGLPVLSGGTLPDFNGDGYTDLLLWSARPPATSVDALARTALNRDYPVRVAAHLYDPETGRYEPVPAGLMETHPPVAWLLLLDQGVPMRHVVLEDFNGDGRTDCGWSSGDRRYEVWFAREAGFPAQPDLVHELPEALLSVAHVVAVRRDGANGVVLRGRHALYGLMPPGGAG